MALGRTGTRRNNDCALSNSPGFLVQTLYLFNNANQLAAFFGE